jgi:fatty acid desaturase/ABC-type phosphate/phosphonate transport system substrate-binding protein
MAHVDKEHLVDMHEPRWSSVFTWFGFASIFFLCQGLLFWSMTAGAWWFSLPLVLVLAHLMHGHLIAFHEAAHGSLCPNPRLNDALGVFIGMFSFMSLSLYRAAHHSHHSYLGTERDEELWPFVIPSKSRWFRCLAALSELILGLVYTPLLFLRALIHPGSVIRNRNRRRRIWMEIGFIVLVWSAVVLVVAFTSAWNYLLVMYLIPASLAGWMQSLRKYIEHMGMTGSTVLSSTRSIVDPGILGRLLAFTLFHEPFHGVHHKYARLPHAALPGFTDDLEPAGPPELPPFLTYRQALLDMLPSLLDPKVGSQWLNSQTLREEGMRHERDEGGGMRDEKQAGSASDSSPVPHPSSLLKIAVALSFGLVSVPFAGAADSEPATRPTTRIAIVKTLFREFPEPLMLALMEPFGLLWKAQIGGLSELRAMDPGDLGEMLADGKVDIGVFHGIEFAWAQQKHRELRPLFIAYNKQPHLRACLVVRGDDKACGFVDLKGKSLALPQGQRIHCQLFMERECQKTGQNRAEEFFSQVAKPLNIELALDGLVDGVYQAAVVDAVGLDSYKHRKPTRFGQIKTVQKSEIFPASVVAYRAGTFDRATVDLLKQRMSAATRNRLTQQLLTLWKLTAIEAVPPDFEETIVNILKYYPPPVSLDDKQIHLISVSRE